MAQSNRYICLWSELYASYDSIMPMKSCFYGTLLILACIVCCLVFKCLIKFGDPWIISSGFDISTHFCLILNAFSYFHAWFKSLP